MFEKSVETLNSLCGSGAFLTAGKEKPNTMTVGWGAIGYIWKKEVVMIPVRSTRYTKQLLDKYGEFTLSVPYSGLKKELGYCGTASGKDEDKFEKAGLEKIPAKKVSTYTVGGCDMYYECKIIAKVEINEKDIIPELMQNYPVKNFHTVYIGEVLDKYGK